MSVMKVPKEPKHLVVVDTPAVNPLPDPAIAQQRLTTATHELGAAFGSVKAAIRPIKGDLDVEVARLETFRKQQPPLWESKMLLKECDATVTTVAGFLATLSQAKTLLDELGPLLDLTERYVQVRRDEAAVASDIDNLEMFVGQLKRARRAAGELHTLVTETENWEAIARVAAGRLFRATQRIVMEYELLRVNAALESFKVQVTKLRTLPSPVTPTLAALHETVEGIVGQPLPLMSITWPEGADPFAGPHIT